MFNVWQEESAMVRRQWLEIKKKISFSKRRFFLVGSYEKKYQQT